jgi:predicted amidohydrolase
MLSLRAVRGVVLAAAALAPLLSCCSAAKSIRVAALPVSTMEGAVASNWARGLALARAAVGQGVPGLNATRVDLLLLPEAFAVGYPACDARGTHCDLLSAAEHRATSARLGAFRELSRTSGATVVVGFIERVSASKGVNYYGQPVQNAVVIYDQGEEVGVHYKTLTADCAEPPPAACRSWRNEGRLLVKGGGIETWRTRAGTFAVYTCSENQMRGGWNQHNGTLDFVISPYNCEDGGTEGGQRPPYNFSCVPGEGMRGCYPQPYCDVYAENAYLSRKFGLPSVWADRTGSVYAGSHYIPNLGTASHGR